jgi:GT2 family glycosyltransferase
MTMAKDSGAQNQPNAPDVSILIVSYNTCAVLRECLQSVAGAEDGLKVEVIVVDNGSRDDSCAMVRNEFPWVRLVESKLNLGFGGANLRAYEFATGRYVVLLNSDAFLRPDSLRLSVDKMEKDPQAGLGGGRLVGRAGEPQPSARMFPTLLSQLLVMSGLADRHPQSKFFGQSDRTWADPMKDAEVDWVPGAYSIIRDSVLRQVGFFDPIFFLYYEEVDLCRRIQQSGYKIMYWPEIVITHIGGESSRQVKTLEMSQSGAQLVLWRMRSTLLFYRKHGGMKAYGARWLEVLWCHCRAFRNRLRSGPEAAIQAQNQSRLARLMDQAWKETRGGRVSPPQPW